MKHIAAATVATVLAGAIAIAQEHPNFAKGTGLSTIDIYREGDAVNLFNGNLIIPIPIGQNYPVNAQLSYGIVLYYNGRPWERRQRCDGGTCYTQTLPSDGSNAGFGWRVSFGGLISPTDARNSSGRWIYEAPDGMQQVFYPTLHEGDPQFSDTEYTRDSSYLRLKYLGNDIYGNPLHDLEFPDGTIHRFVGEILSQIRDRYGNYVNFTLTTGTGTKTITIQDQHGRTHYIRYATQTPATNYYITQIDLAGFGGSRSIYAFSNTVLNIPRGCGDTDPQTAATADVAVLSSITLPDGSSYAMPAYQADNTNCQSGLLQQLRLPTYGTIEWDYQYWTFPTPAGDSRSYRYAVPGVARRRLRNASGVIAGEWVYETQLVAAACYPRELITSVTTPRSDKTKHYFSVFISPDTCSNTEGWSPMDYGLPFTRNAARQTSPNRFLSTERFADAGATQLLRTMFTRYEREAFSVTTEDGWASDRNRRLVSERTLFNDDAGRYADVDFSLFDGLGHYRQRDTNGNFDSGNVRSTFTNYNAAVGTLQVDGNGNRLPGFTMLDRSAPWVLSTYSDSRVSEAGVAFLRQFCFEAGTGHLLRQRILGGDLPAATDLLTSFTRDSQGNTIREERFGGDASAGLSGGDICSTPLPAAELRIDSIYQYGVQRKSDYIDTVGLPVLSIVDRDIDLSTGLANTSRDPAGLAVSYQYDGLGRIRWIIPPAYHGGRTEYLYTAASGAASPAKLDLRNWDNAGGTILAQTQTVYDSFGRVWKDKQLMPNGTWSTREHGYDAAGLETFVSEMEAADPPLNRTQFVLDAFGRMTRSTTPDGKATTVQYAGNRTVTMTRRVRTSGDALNIVETDSASTQIYDRQGRLWQVREPSRPDGTDTITQYAYNATDSLTSVWITVPEGTQTRSFNYDRRGLLMSEQRPEVGTAGNGTVSYQYNASGQMARKDDPRVTLYFYYDRAMRLYQVLDRNLAQWKYFTFATANNGPGEWGKGKLREAMRHNRSIDGFTDVVVRETYTYSGKGGRVSTRETSFTENQAITFSQSVVYDDLGQVLYQTYPRCVDWCANSNDTLTNSYTNGFLTGVGGWANTITYHPNGLVAQVNFANGASWVQQNDPWSMPRPLSISSSGAATNWTSGTYTYDGSGNVAAMGTDYVLYDKTSRPKEGTAYAAGSKLQQYTYDSLGSIVSKTTVVNGVPSTTDLSVNWQTNHLLSGTYDGSGNLVRVGTGDSYDYDVFGRVRQIALSGAGPYTYVYTADDVPVRIFDQWGQTATWRFHDFDGKVLSEYTSAFPDPPADVWNLVNYVYRDGTLLGRYSPQLAFTNRYYIVDHEGTPRQTLDINRWQIGQNAYYPVGEEATTNALPAESMRFRGMERNFCCASSSSSVDFTGSGHQSPIFARLRGINLSSADLADPQSWNAQSSTLRIATNDEGQPDVQIDPSWIPIGGLNCYFNIKTKQMKCGVKIDVGSGGGSGGGWSGGGSGGGGGGDGGGGDGGRIEGGGGGGGGGPAPAGTGRRRSVRRGPDLGLVGPPPVVVTPILTRCALLGGAIYVGHELGTRAGQWCRDKVLGTDEDETREEHCEELWKDDREECNRRWKDEDERQNAACHAQAATRYSECLRYGEPRSPLSP